MVAADPTVESTPLLWSILIDCQAAIPKKLGFPVGENSRSFPMIDQKRSISREDAGNMHELGSFMVTHSEQKRTQHMHATGGSSGIVCERVTQAHPSVSPRVSRVRGLARAGLGASGDS